MDRTSAKAHAKMPMAKMAETLNFLLVDMCSDHIALCGMARIRLHQPKLAIRARSTPRGRDGEIKKNNTYKSEAIVKIEMAKFV